MDLTDGMTTTLSGLGNKEVGLEICEGGRYVRCVRSPWRFWGHSRFEVLDYGAAARVEGDPRGMDAVPVTGELREFDPGQKVVVLRPTVTGLLARRGDGSVLWASIAATVANALGGGPR